MKRYYLLIALWAVMGFVVGFVVVDEGLKQQSIVYVKPEIPLNEGLQYKTAQLELDRIEDSKLPYYQSRDARSMVGTNDRR